MKPIILISFIVGFFTTSAFSQEKLSLNLGTTGIDVPNYTDLGTYYQESRQHPMTVLSLPELNHESEEKAQEARNTQNSLDILGNNWSYDNMPCVKPLLTETMPVVKPDMTIFYTLKVKKMK
ncbi:hypothetical protein [Prolixibacter denitrificans]|uniref:Uncharacterized protein n=1 Tax=Prolixibacter denitrificans TaxID=1541063 RepID=A0A2P8CJL1_9BACT|nr:hypothetical protein [Prolixibacter denitrificans]PSK85160.1 hypothetical protein CLV93_101112 [Prolixibacter denitrificans]GET19784.1 hypothetical protein JCM18694_00300 [Prolixibacter denitrificans]